MFVQEVARAKRRPRTLTAANGPIHADVSIPFYRTTRAERFEKFLGFPIKVDGEIVGAIGVSGAPTVKNASIAREQP
jgi:hypothetical protein